MIGTNMRIIVLSLVLASSLFLLAEAATQNESISTPTSKQLLNTQVGSTHIPAQAKTEVIVNPYANNPMAIIQGRKLFNSMNCSGCHAPQGGGGMGPPLSDDQWIYGSSPAQIYLTIAQGRPNGMPAFGSILPDDSIWKLVAYINTLNSSTHAKSEK